MFSQSSRRSSLITSVAVLLLAAISSVTLFALLTSSYGWKIYLEVFSHFQLQYFILSLVFLGFLLLTRHRLMSFLGTFCCSVLLVIQILPWYIPPAALLPKPVPNLRVLIANINTQNQQFDRVLSLTREVQPDLALFMEVSDIWVEKLNTLQDILPFTSGQANPYNVGIVIYSRFQLENAEVVSFSEDSTPSVTATVEVEGRSLDLVGTHPLPPIKTNFFHSRNRQLNAITAYLETVENPVLVIGDLNITMWSPYYKQFIRRTGLKNARKGFGILPSWPTRGTYQQVPGLASLLLSIPIDHCLLSPGNLQVTNIYTGTRIGSDHLPVIVDLAVR